MLPYDPEVSLPWLESAFANDATSSATACASSASRTNLTASFLSQVENDQSSVSLASLQRIATALEVPMFAFLENSPPPTPVMRAEERPQARHL